MYGNSVKIHKSLVALMLLASAKVDEARRVSIMVAAWNRGHIKQERSNDEIIQDTLHENVASMLRQCENSVSAGSSSSSTLHAKTCRMNGQTGGNQRNDKRCNTTCSPIMHVREFLS